MSDEETDGGEAPACQNVKMERQKELEQRGTQTTEVEASTGDSVGLGTAGTLWKLINECLVMYADEEDEEIESCLERMNLVLCRRSSSASSSNNGLEHGLVALVEPNDGAEAMRAVAALLFDDHFCSLLMDALDEMDELLEDAEAEEQEEDDFDIDDDLDDLPPPPHRKSQDREYSSSARALIRIVERLQGAPDPTIRRWAIKGLWRLLHVIVHRENIHTLLPGLKFFEEGRLRVESVTLSALLDPPQPDFHPTEGNAKIDFSRREEARPFIVRKAFGQSLLGRMVSVEQRGRKLGSKASFVLGCNSSIASNESSGAGHTNHVAKFELGSFETGKWSSKSSEFSKLGETSDSGERTFSLGQSEKSLRSSLSSTHHSLQSPSEGEERDFFNEDAVFTVSPRGRQQSNFSGLGHSKRDSNVDRFSGFFQQRRSLPQTQTNFNLGSNTTKKIEAEQNGEVRMSGLGTRTSRTNQMMMHARRSSLSMVGSVHTFMSEDLAFGEPGREGSGLGLERAFVFPRLTGISIPEHQILAEQADDRAIWSSKSNHLSGSLDASTLSGNVSGLCYSDCATAFEIILGQLVEPTDANPHHTVNPFTQRLSVAARDMIPTLLSMLAWMSDNIVRKEFIASLYTLCHSCPANLSLLVSLDSWRTGLLRILQTIPRDKEFRDETSESMVSHITEMLCLTTIPCSALFPICHFKAAVHTSNDLKVGLLLYEISVLSGWNQDTVGFSRTVLTTCAELLLARKRASGPLLLSILHLVEMFALYMPSREDALLGFSVRTKSLMKRMHRKKSQRRLLSHRTLDATSSQVNTSESDCIGENNAVDPEFFDSIEEEDDCELVSESSTSGPSELTSEAEDDYDGEKYRDNWHWAPLLKQCSHMEMAENQVDHLEFQNLFLRRGVDFGLHLNQTKSRFVDGSLLQLALRLGKSISSQTDQESISICAAASLARLKSIVDHLQLGERNLLFIEKSASTDLENDRAKSEEVQLDVQLDLLDQRVSSGSYCPCTFCQNLYRGDVATKLCMYRPTVSKRSEDDLLEIYRRSEHIILSEPAEEARKVHRLPSGTSNCSPNTEIDSEDTDGFVSTENQYLDGRCPVCKQGAQTTKAGGEHRRSNTATDSDSLVDQLGKISLRSDSIAEELPDQGSQPSPVQWKGFMWHPQHLRCYTCSKVISIEDGLEDQPVFDRVSGWPFCSECGHQRMVTCNHCMGTIDEFESFSIPEHRSWHSLHLRCMRCGVPCEEENWCNLSLAFLCPSHEQEEHTFHCKVCFGEILEQAGVHLGGGKAVHDSFPCFSCRACSVPLTEETACVSDLPEPSSLYCTSCQEKCVRPTCASCTSSILFSEDRYVVVPSREDRADNEDFDIIDGVIAGSDGRLRIHVKCMQCIICGKSDFLHENELVYLHSSQSEGRFHLYCKEHIRALVLTPDTLQLGSKHSDNGILATSESQDASGRVSAGFFLYIDASGQQSGPVSGQELCELADRRVIGGSTQIWTPGMPAWKPLSELGV